MKKILMILLAGLLALTLTGCMGAANQETLPTLAVPEEEVVGGMPSPEKYDADLAGLCSFMEDGQAVAAGEGYPVETAYDVIGAQGGNRYRFSYNKSPVQIEFYEFDPDALSAEADALLSDALAEEKVTILHNTVPALASSDKHFLMIYIETKQDDVSKAHTALTKEYFTKFCQSKQEE